MEEHKEAKNCRQIIEVQFNISMHCNACERLVAKVISKIKGVHNIVTDMTRDRVIVTGQFCPHKVLKKLKKKTGKRVDIINDKQEDECHDEDGGIESKGGDDKALEHIFLSNDFPILFHEWCERDNSIFTIFSDENANSCSIM